MLSLTAAALSAVAFLAIAAAVAVVARRRALPQRGDAALVALALLVAAAMPGALALADGLGLAVAVVAVATALLAVPRLLRRRERVSEEQRALELSNLRFRQALSRSSITVFAQDRDLRYTWVYNPRTGLPTEAILGRTAADFAPPGMLEEADALKRKALETGQTVNDTIALATENDGRRYFDMTVSPTFGPFGAIDGVLCTAVDVTEMRLFEVRLTAMASQLASAYQRFELALDNSPITVFEQDADLVYTYVYNPPPGTRAEDFIDHSDDELFPEADAARLRAPKQRVLETGARESIEIEIEVGGTLRYYDVRFEPKRSIDGAVIGIIATALDLTERRRDEQRIRLMLRELTHRSKNLLAVIQAMARKTASLSGDLDGFISDFSSRLRAIAAAHDLLVTQSWHGADVRELVAASISPTIAPDAPQLTLAGPALTLTPDVAQNLGLAFHELATNASKYGALSSVAGHVDVGWTRDGLGNVRILWRETGGPPVVPPERHGFGRVLLERLVGTTLNGKVTLDFRPEGLVCEIVFPGAGLPPEPAPDAAPEPERASG